MLVTKQDTTGEHDGRHDGGHDGIYDPVRGHLNRCILLQPAELKFLTQLQFGRFLFEAHEQIWNGFLLRSLENARR
jgi:hypothetical protein